MKVSIVMITYAHEKFIYQSIYGILNQIVNFEIELIIADDNTNNDTENIVNTFKNHPKNNCIKYTKHKVNKGMTQNFIWALNQTNGKYIALCEGDDYWTYPYKLQKQVDFLEQNEDYVITLHHRNRLLGNEFTYDECKDGFIFLQCMVFRRFEFDEFYIQNLKNIMYGDAFLYYKLLSLGKCKILDFNGAVYRIHENGIHSGLDRLKGVENNLDSLITIKKYHKTLNNLEIVKILNMEITKSYIVLLQINLKKIKIINFFKIFLQSFSNISIFNYLEIIKKKLHKIE